MNTSFKSVYEDGHNTGNDKVSNMNNSLSYRTVDGLNTDWSSVALYARQIHFPRTLYFVGRRVARRLFAFRAKMPPEVSACAAARGARSPSIGGSWLVTGERFMRRLTFWIV